MGQPWSSEHGAEPGRALPTPDVETLDRLLRAPARPFWSETWRERVTWWPPNRRRATVAAVVVVLVGALVAWRVWAPAAAVSVELPRAGVPSGGATVSPPTTVSVSSPAVTTVPEVTVPVEVTLHVAGAVLTPGVVRVAGTARWGDAVAAAGGAAADADLDRVNLAAPVVDGARLFVPRRGSEPPSVVAVDSAGAAGTAGAVGTAGAIGSPGSAEAQGEERAPIDLNDATAEQLDTLPGVGPATAAAILQHRQQHGPFRSVTELQDVSGIGPARFERLAPLVTVGGSGGGA